MPKRAGRKGKYPLYLGSILVRLAGLASAKRSKSDGSLVLAGGRCHSHTTKRPTHSRGSSRLCCLKFVTGPKGAAPAATASAKGKMQSRGACRRGRKVEARSIARMESLPISMTGRDSPKLKADLDRPPSARPTPCRIAMPASSPSSSMAAKGARRWLRPCASSRRSTTSWAASCPMRACFTPPIAQTPSGRNSSATSRRRSPPSPRSSCSFRSSSTGSTMRSSRRRWSNPSSAITALGSRICARRSPISSTTSSSSCSTRRR